jgi:hypothetical protein
MTDQERLKLIFDAYDTWIADWDDLWPESVFKAIEKAQKGCRWLKRKSRRDLADEYHETADLFSEADAG